MDQHGTRVPPRRRGRPRASEVGEARGRIIAAATEEFAERGYEAASIRAIARRAEVDPALIRHYFDDKQALVAAVVEVPLRPDRVVRGALDGPFDGIGAALVTGVVRAWDSPAVRPAALAALRGAVGQGPVSRMLREFLRRELMHRIAARLVDEGVADGEAELRAEFAVSQIVGLIMVRYVLVAEPLASLPPEEVVRRLAPVVQFHLTGDAQDLAGAGLDSAAHPAKNSSHDE
ncbi:TetR family transcriptional regulator [Agromyces mediolanus]|uniref:TetR/AcrR family transcriptional regulator n=1 Tax=Agromyces mediolanus TaxID=41986 RepID=UPI0038358637